MSSRRMIGQFIVVKDTDPNTILEAANILNVSLKETNPYATGHILQFIPAEKGKPDFVRMIAFEESIIDESEPFKEGDLVTIKGEDTPRRIVNLEVTPIEC